GALLHSWFGDYYGPGGAGGYARGGGIYVGGGTAIIRNTTITANTANGGAGGHGTHGSADGAPGVGEGGGIYIYAGTSAGLDMVTVSHMRRNKASDNGDNIAGAYAMIP